MSGKNPNIAKEIKFLLWLSVSFVLFALLLFILGISLGCDDFCFFIQIVVGIECPNDMCLNKDTLLLLYPLLAFPTLLSIGPILAIAWIWLNLLTDRGEKMQLADTLGIHELDLKFRIRDHFLSKITSQSPEELDKELDNIFADSARKLKSDLDIAFGEERANKIMETLRIEI